MIHSMRGIVIQSNSHYLIVEVAGVGLGVTVLFPEKFKQGDEVNLVIAFQWNQESGPSLYGFTSVTERELFTLIISCSGIGPKLALLLLQQSSVSQISSAIVRSDQSYLSSLKGIGMKKAESLIIQLRDKVEHLTHTSLSTTDSLHTDVFHDISRTLQALRYSPGEVAQALEYVQKQPLKEDASFEYIMRIALSYFTRSGKNPML